MMRYFSYLFLVAILVVISCEKGSDATMLKGTVKGQIQVTDCYGYDLDDLSGVKINISSGTYSADTITDVHGNFLFNNVPFGKYKLTCTKENFIQQNRRASFGHSGGEIATTVKEQLFGIPDFGYIVDSVERYNCQLNSYLMLNEASKTWGGGIYLVLMFYNDTSDVDSENYDAYQFDLKTLPPGNAWKMFFFCCDIYTGHPAYSEITGDSVYCRVYPIPYCYVDTQEEYLSLPMGKPSNVFAFENNF